MDSLAKHMRKAVLIAKNLAGGLDPSFKRNALKRGGYFTGGAPKHEPKLPIKIGEGATEDMPHRVLDLSGGHLHSGIFRTNKHVHGYEVGGTHHDPQHEKWVNDQVKAQPVDSVIGPATIHRFRDPEFRAMQYKRAHENLKPGGRAYFVINQGDGSGVYRSPSGSSFQQNNLPATAYMGEMQKFFPKVKRIENVLIGEKESEDESN